ncbi:uncharacterized protein il17rc isoform X2 [Genypterus blacodes]
MDVSDLTLKAGLCCEDGAPCSLCLLIDMELYTYSNKDMEDEDRSSRDDEDFSKEIRNLKASVTLCYSTAAMLTLCKRVEFVVKSAALDHQDKTKMSIVIKKPVGVSFTSTVFVHLPKQPDIRRDITVPSLDEVCSTEIQQRIKECAVPTFSTVIKQKANEVELQVSGRDKSLQSYVCMQHELKGRCLLLTKRTIPFYQLTTCTCLQVWTGDGDHRSRRSRSCPFENHTDVFQRNIWKNLSVSVANGLMNDNGAKLSWNVSAPCRLEAEVWPCVALGESSCKEMKGFRQQANGTWRQNSKGLWETLGVFEDINLQLSPCVMVKVKGMEKTLGPFCFNDTSRWRWNLLVVAIVLLVCLTALISCLLQDSVKRWVRICHGAPSLVKGGKGHVVLLSPPEVDSVVSEAVCRLGSLLFNKGFSVSVDQWTRKDQCSLGPLPWLHSQLLKLDSMGGRIVLVLTRKALERTEEWTKQDKAVPQTWSPYSDVFTTSLFLIQADKQLGRARERFLLVNFDSHPAQTSSRDKSLPEVLQGLTLLHLPSQTQALLSELTVGHKKGRSVRRTWSLWRWGASNGRRAGTREKLDQQRESSCKSVRGDSKWETKPLNQ